jgi:ATP-binding cassette subfamily B protein
MHFPFAEHGRALRLADTVIVLKEGRIEAAGALDDVLATSSELRAIWSGQVRPG